MSDMRFLMTLGFALAACNGADPVELQPSASAPSASASAPAPDAARLGALLRAELSRQPSQVSLEDLSNRDVKFRRAAARALARSRSPEAREGLLRLLHDEDDRVVAWAAYGLGDHCAGHRSKTVSALVALAASRAPKPSPRPAPSKTAASGSVSAAPKPPPAPPPAPPQTPDAALAWRALTRAIGRCASIEAETTLVAWARERDSHSIDAIHALGDVATQHRKLREESVVALLELASGNAANSPMADALYPIGRIEHLAPSVMDRTFEVAKARLADKGAARLYAVKALGRCDDEAISLLRDAAIGSDGSTPAERAEAARGLARFGQAGQRALRKVLEALVAEDGKPTTEAGAGVGVLLSVIQSLTSIGRARSRLGKLAERAPAEGASDAAKRRLSWLRCSAAKLLAERDFDNPVLRACDLSIPADKQAEHPLPGTIGARAVVEAIGVDGVKIRGKRLKAWQAYATGGDLRAREAALELLKEHSEIRVAADVLAKALAAKESGLLGTAALIIAKHPKRARQPGKTKKEDGPVHPEVIVGLKNGLDGKGAAADLESLADVIDAVAALKLDDTRGRLLKLCSSPYTVVREHSRIALSKLLGGADKVQCKPPEPLPLPAELDQLAKGKLHIEMTTDAGAMTLELDADLAPIAVTRARDLVNSGYYNDMVVHRVVPGFVSQFGSPTADGYGGAPKKLPMPCETSPSPFTPMSVGVALAGRDTGSSQLFVTHTATPHLDGKYAILGTATGPWDALVDGDRIIKAKIVER